MPENINELKDLLRKLRTINKKIQGAAIFSIQGLPFCSALAKDDNEGIISAISGALIAVSERAVEELARGNFKRIVIEGETGKIHLYRIGNDAILCIICGDEISLKENFLDNFKRFNHKKQAVEVDLT